MRLGGCLDRPIQQANMYQSADISIHPLTHPSISITWHQQIETLSALLVFCEGNLPVTGGFPSQRPATRSFDAFLICSWPNGWTNTRDAADLRRHRAHQDATVMNELYGNTESATIGNKEGLIWMLIVDGVHTAACVSHCSLLCFVLCNADFILYVMFILHQKCYLLLPCFRMSHFLYFTQSLNAIDCFCMLVYTMYNRFNGYSQCTVSYAPFYVCNERSAMTSIKYFKVQSSKQQASLVVFTGNNFCI